VAAQPLHDLPLVVLARGSEDELPPEFAAKFPPGLLDASAAAWRASQTRLAALVPDARLVIATDSGHYVQADQPALVIEAIRQVVEGVRHPNTWSDLVACCAPGSRYGQRPAPPEPTGAAPDGAIGRAMPRELKLPLRGGRWSS
jgi:hypothetical protein